MSHSVDETYKVYQVRIVRARKPHRCCACRDPITVGDRYAYVFIIDADSSVYTYKRCLRCQVIFAELVKRLGRFEAWPDEDLNCGHTWGDAKDQECMLAESPPDEIAALAFLTPAEVQALTPESM